MLEDVGYWNVGFIPSLLFVVSGRGGRRQTSEHQLCVNQHDVRSFSIAEWQLFRFSSKF